MQILTPKQHYDAYHNMRSAIESRYSVELHHGNFDLPNKIHILAGVRLDGSFYIICGESDRLSMRFYSEIADLETLIATIDRYANFAHSEMY